MTDSMAEVLAHACPRRHAVLTEHESWGFELDVKYRVGTLLLGGKPRTVSVPAEADRTVASAETSPRIRIVRLPQAADAPVATVTALRTRAS
jgi:hypothetical protein